MNRGHWGTISVLLALIGVVGLALAQDKGPAAGNSLLAPTGTAFIYQGSLSKAGQSYDGSCDMRFKLFDQDAGGNQVGSVLVLNNVSVVGGLFNVPLDFGAVYDGKALWLQLEVSCPVGSGYEILSPRQPLTATPYALFALDAGRLDGKVGADYAGVDHEHSNGGAFWSLTGNSGTSTATNFLGTIDDQALDLSVNSQRALRLEPGGNSPNVIGGHSSNGVFSNAVGATIGGGGQGGGANTVYGNYGTIGGGWFNNLTGSQSTIGGGYGNTTTGINNTIAGGYQNNTIWNNDNGAYVSIGGGRNNRATGLGAIIPGGSYNVALGDHSFAAGYHALAADDGAFVWVDNKVGREGDWGSSAANEFSVYATGGVRFITGLNTSNGQVTGGAYLAPGSGSWGSWSDRTVKRNIEAVDTDAVLESVMAMPISTWNYVDQDDSIRHIGPMAQDFAAAFRVGEDERMISVVDADGVALAAIQSLYSENEHLREQVEAQDARLKAVESENRNVDDWTRGVAVNDRYMLWLLLLAAVGGAVIAGGLTVTVVLLLFRQRFRLVQVGN